MKFSGIRKRGMISWNYKIKSWWTAFRKLMLRSSFILMEVIFRLLGIFDELHVFIFKSNSRWRCYRKTLFFYIFIDFFGLWQASIETMNTFLTKPASSCLSVSWFRTQKPDLKNSKSKSTSKILQFTKLYDASSLTQ